MHLSNGSFWDMPIGERCIIWETTSCGSIRQHLLPPHPAVPGPITRCPLLHHYQRPHPAQKFGLRRDPAHRGGQTSESAHQLALTQKKASPSSNRTNGKPLVVVYPIYNRSRRRISSIAWSNGSRRSSCSKAYSRLVRIKPNFSPTSKRFPSKLYA